MTTAALDIRRLTYADLPQVIAIERRAFPTPWSLAMFVLELSQAGGHLPRGAAATGALVGYLICSRYDDGLARDERRRRPAAAAPGASPRALLGELLEPRRRGRRASRSRCAPRTHRAIALYERFGFRAAGMRRRYYQDNGEDALIMWRTPATLEGRLDDVPNPGPVAPT